MTVDFTRFNEALGSFARIDHEYMSASYGDVFCGKEIVDARFEMKTALLGTKEAGLAIATQALQEIKDNISYAELSLGKIWNCKEVEYLNDPAVYLTRKIKSFAAQEKEGEVSINEQLIRQSVQNTFQKCLDARSGGFDFYSLAGRHIDARQEYKKAFEDVLDQIYTSMIKDLNVDLATKKYLPYKLGYVMKDWLKKKEYLSKI